ncbi:hypothetical protein K8I28_13400 [bacterium]|nr:hypothetical protein [bacterium]
MQIFNKLKTTILAIVFLCSVSIMLSCSQKSNSNVHYLNDYNTISELVDEHRFSEAKQILLNKLNPVNKHSYYLLSYVLLSELKWARYTHINGKNLTKAEIQVINREIDPNGFVLYSPGQYRLLQPYSRSYEQLDYYSRVTASWQQFDLLGLLLISLEYSISNDNEYPYMQSAREWLLYLKSIEKSNPGKYAPYPNGIPDVSILIERMGDLVKVIELIENEKIRI